MSPAAKARKVAIVTGAAQGIGKAIALRLAEESYDLALFDLPSSSHLLDDVSSLIERTGQSAIFLTGDVSSEKDVYSMIEETVGKMGRLDVMVANAGIAPVASFLDMTPELFDKIHAVNVRGVFLCYQAAAKQMVKQGSGGRLIAACSVSGIRTGPNLTGYCASKFAVRAINQGAAIELGKYGITANVYCPTVVTTDMWKTIDQEISTKNGWTAGEYTVNRAKVNPLGRNATPEDIAGMVAFLVSKDASYVTGQAMQVTGGDGLS